MACIAVILGPIAPAAQALPGGKANYVVSFGLLRQGTSGDDWVRLGTYQLGTDGRVRSRTWWWDQRQPAARVGTGTVPAGTRSGTDDTVRRCEIQTVAGFTSAAPNCAAALPPLHRRRRTADRQHRLGSGRVAV